MAGVDKTVEVHGVPVSIVDVESVLADMAERIAAKSIGGYISITNSESMYHARRIPAHLDYIRRANYSLCDGVGVIVASISWGHRVPRLTGPMLQLQCCRFGVKRGWRHFFYGGKEGIAERLAENLARAYPGMVTAGVYCPPFRELTPEEDEQIVRLINEAKPDIVWVGLGLLKQERWIAQHLRRIGAPWMVGVGAAFDYHASAVRWAPAWVRAIGMEWLFRLILQPRLRARRCWHAFVFIVEAVLAGIAYHAKRLMDCLWNLRVDRSKS